MNLKKYLKVWYLMTVSAVMVDLSRRRSAFLLLVAKGVRLILFFVFLIILFSGGRKISGYSFEQALVFFLTFNLIDGLSQLFLRGAYFFRRLVVNGELDYKLARPLNPLFNVLASHTDVLDFIMLWPILLALIYSLSLLSHLSFFSYLIYFLLVLNGLLLTAAFHIWVISLAITTYEVDNAMMIYRDLSSLGRVPVDLYREPIRFLVTFVLPVGVMVTFPVKALLGLLSGPVILVSLAVSFVFLYLSLKVWDWSLRSYSSASS